jgi:hypothetical protein
VLAQRDWLVTEDQPGERVFFTTGDLARFSTALRDLLGLRVGVKQALWLRAARGEQGVGDGMPAPQLVCVSASET